MHFLRILVAAAMMILAVSLLFFYGVPVPYAQEELWAAPEETPGQTGPGPEQDTLVDEAHAYVSRTILSTAEWLDSFFDTERVRSEENRTTLRLTSSYFKEEGKTAESKFGVNLRLVLPETMERLHLEVGNAVANDISGTSSKSQTPEDGEETSAEDGTDVSLGYAVKDTLRRYFSTSTGLRFKGIKPVAFLETRYREVWQLNPWAFRLTERIRWYTDRGLESNMTLDLERPWAGVLFFRSTPYISWFQEKDGIFYGLDLSMQQPLGTRSALIYEWTNNFVTSPENELAAIALRVRYRQRIWREWIILDTFPQVAFPREEDYDPVPGFFVQIESIWGSYR